MAPLVSPYLLFLLAMLTMPEATKEFRIDVVEPTGTVTCAFARRTADGCEVFTKKDGATVKVMTLSPVKGKERVYLVKDDEKGNEETIDLAEQTHGLSEKQWSSGDDASATGPEGAPLKTIHSGPVTYVSAGAAGMMLAVHP